MKKITLLLTLITMSFGHSQSLPINFDESIDPLYYFTCYDCNFNLTTDPDDPSNPVGLLTSWPTTPFGSAQTLTLDLNIDLSDIKEQ